MTSVIVGGGFVFFCYWHLHTPAYQHFTHTCTVEEVKSSPPFTSLVHSTHNRDTSPSTQARHAHRRIYKPTTESQHTHTNIKPSTSPYNGIITAPRTPHPSKAHKPPYSHLKAPASP